jgi:hypothetical protein
MTEAGQQPSLQAQASAKLVDEQHMRRYVRPALLLAVLSLSAAACNSSGSSSSSSSCTPYFQAEVDAHNAWQSAGGNDADALGQAGAAMIQAHRDAVDAGCDDGVDNGYHGG